VSVAARARACRLVAAGGARSQSQLNVCAPHVSPYLGRCVCVACNVCHVTERTVLYGEERSLVSAARRACRLAGQEALAEL